MFDDCVCNVSFECPPNQAYCPPFGDCQTCVANNEVKEIVVDEPEYIMGNIIKCSECNNPATHYESGVFYCPRHWSEWQEQLPIPPHDNVIYVDFNGDHRHVEESKLCNNCGKNESEITLENGPSLCFNCYRIIY